MSKMRGEEQGMIAILTVMILSLLLVIVTTGFLRLMIRNNRQVADAQLSSQAFYAAETGLEDAKKAILDPNFKVAYPTANKTDCAPFTLSDGSNPGGGVISPEVEYTCQLINATPKKLTYNVSESQAVLAQLRAADSATGFDTVKITWSKSDDDTGPALHPFTSPLDNINNLPTAPNWGSRLAMIRVELMAVTKNGSDQLTRDQFYRNERTYFVSPKTGNYRTYPNGVVPVTFCPFTAPNNGPGSLNCSLDTQFNDGIKPADCDLTTNKCSITFELHQPNGLDLGHSDTIQWGTSGTSGPQTLNDNYNVRLRVRSIYKAAHVEVELLHNGVNGTPVETVDGQVSLDVTGKAQDVYRRIHAVLPVLPPKGFFPDYTVEVAEDVCKLFRVTPPNSVVDGGCGSDADGNPIY